VSELPGPLESLLLLLVVVEESCALPPLATEDTHSPMPWLVLSPVEELDAADDDAALQELTAEVTTVPWLVVSDLEESVESVCVDLSEELLLDVDSASEPLELDCEAPATRVSWCSGEPPGGFLKSGARMAYSSARCVPWSRAPFRRPPRPQTGHRRRSTQSRS
jgi:hypothetical protein